MRVISRQYPAGDALRRKLRRTLKSTRNVFYLAATGLGEPNVHATRRDLKFLRSLLVAIRPVIGGKRFRRETSLLRKASKALADRRKAEAVVETVARLREVAGDARQIEALVELSRAADGLMATPGTDARRKVMKNISRSLARLRGEIRSWPLPAYNPRTYVEGMTRAYGRARRLIRQGVSTGNTSDLHEGRKWLIRHLHHVEMLAPIWPDVFWIWVTELRGLRTQMGELNDLGELEHLLLGSDGTFGPVKERDSCMEQILARRNTLLNEIEPSSRRLFSEKPKAFGRRIEVLWQDFMV